MSTSYGARTGLGTPATNDRNWDVPLAADLTLLDSINALGALMVDFAEHPSATLNVRVAAGMFRKMDGSTVTYAGTSAQAIATASTKVVYLTNAGTLTVAASYPTSGPYFPLATVVAGATTITSITDNRPAPTIVCGSANVGTATLVAGTIPVSAPQITASSIVMVTRKTIGGTTGTMSYTLTAGTGFTLNSSSASDTSTFVWQIIEP